MQSCRLILANALGLRFCYRAPGKRSQITNRSCKLISKVNSTKAASDFIIIGRIRGRTLEESHMWQTFAPLPQRESVQLSWGYCSPWPFACHYETRRQFRMKLSGAQCSEPASLVWYGEARIICMRWEWRTEVDRLWCAIVSTMSFIIISRLNYWNQARYCFVKFN